jgi:hypothetical protein
MRRMHLTAKGVALALVAALGVTAAGSTVMLNPQAYYTFSVGYLAASAQTLSGTAAAGGLDVLIYSGDTVPVLHSTQTGSVDVQQMLLSSDRLLVVDGDRFYLRMAGALLSYELRPGCEGIELIVSSRESIDLIEALTQIMGELETVGIGGMDVDLGGYRTVVRNPFKGPAAPAEVAAKLDYTLYGLLVSEDWFVYAHEKGLALLGLRIEVVVEKTPGSDLPAAFAGNTVSETAELASLVVPVDRLVSLALSNGVGYVRLPYVPVVP